MEVAALGLKVDGVSGIDKASESLDKLTGSAGNAERAAEGLQGQSKTTTKALADAAREGDKSSASMSRLAGAAKLAAGIFAGFKLTSFISEITLANSRLEQLDLVMGVVGRNASLSQDQVSAYAKEVEAMGISMTESRQTVIRMIQAQMDLSKASSLARLAQDAAVIANTNSSDALSRLIYGLQSGQVEILRNMGLNVNFANSYKNLADQLGVTTDQLSEADKVQARTNAVMAAGAQIAGAYDASMENAGKQLGSTTRYLQDLGVMWGEVFSDAASDAIFGYSDALKGLHQSTREMQESGSLERISESLATMARGLVTAAKVTGTFAVAIYAIPALQGAWALALAAKAAALRLFTAQVVTATGALGLLQRSLMVVAAAFAGWQIGTYLRNEFEIVEKAGIALAGGLHAMAVRIEGFFEVAGANIRFALTSPMDAARLAVADYLQWLTGLGSTALRALGLDGLADSISSDFASLRGTAASEHKAMIDGIKRNTASEAAAVSDIYADMFAQVGKSTESAAKKIKDETGGIVETVKELSEEQKTLLNTYDQILAQYHRQVTLGKEATEVEQLLYEVQYGRLKGLQPEQQKVLEGLAAELDARAKLASAAEAGKQFETVMTEVGGMTGNSEIDRLNEVYERRKEIIDNALNAEYLSKATHEAAMLKLDEQTSAARSLILEEQAEQERQAALQTMANVVSITQSQIQQMQGLLAESTSLGKAFFAVSQALAAANAIVQGYQSAMAIRTAYATMASTAGFGASSILAAGEVHANVAQGMGFATAGLIMGQAISGFQSGGYTGNAGTSQVAGVVHGQEYVFDAQSTSRIGVANLEAMRKGKAVAGNVVQFPSGKSGGNSFTVHAPVTVEGQAGMTGDQARQQGESVASAVQATIVSTLEKESRPGGMLWQMYGAGR